MSFNYANPNPLPDARSKVRLRNIRTSADIDGIGYREKRTRMAQQHQIFQDNTSESGEGIRLRLENLKDRVKSRDFEYLKDVGMNRAQFDDTAASRHPIFQCP